MVHTVAHTVLKPMFCVVTDLQELEFTDLHLDFAKVQQPEVRQLESDIQAVVLSGCDRIVKQAQRSQRLNVSEGIKVCQLKYQVSGQHQCFQVW
jgi:hypothetical protein